MRTELWIVLVTGFLIYNAYHDNKYTKVLMKGRKYYSMIIYGAMGLGIYLLLKRDPNQAKNMLMYANNAVRYMPINKSSLNLFNPIVDFTSTYNDGDPNANMTGSFMRSFNNANNLSEERILKSVKLPVFRKNVGGRGLGKSGPGIISDNISQNLKQQLNTREKHITNNKII